MPHTYKYDQYASDMVKGLNELREEVTLCDGVLQASDEQRFSIHRCVLAAASPYFKAMFASEFKEANNNMGNPIVLPTITSVGLKCVLDCLYSGELTMTNETVYDVLPAAHMMQLVDIVKSCVHFMVQGVSLTTCFQNQKLGVRYELSQVKKTAHRFILRNFVTLSTSTEFKEMPKDELCRYLQDRKLNGTEVEIFRAARQWLDFEPDRKQYLADVMSSIDFKAIPQGSLLDDVLGDELIKLNRECFDKVLDALKYHCDVCNQPFNRCSELRGTEAVVIIESGTTSDDGTYATSSPATMSIYRKSDVVSNFKHKKTVQETAISLKFKVVEASLNHVTLNNFLYLFGTDSDTFGSFAKRFDGTTVEWIDLAAPPPRLETVGSSAVCVNNKVILVGGMLVNRNSKGLDSSEITDATISYKIACNAWNIVSSCPTEVVYHASCSHSNLVYIAGGYVPAEDGCAVSKKLYAYDSKADLWLSKADMNHGRAEAILEAVGNKLFFIGGGEFYVAMVQVPSIEMYDILENQWTMVENEPGFPYDSAASFVDGQNIVIVGGENYEISSNSDGISMFNTKTKKIDTFNQKLELTPSRHVSTVLKLQNI